MQNNSILNSYLLSIYLIVIVISNSNYANCKELPQNSSRSSAQFGQNCNNDFSVTCIKMNIVGYIEKLSERREFSLMPGISVVREVSDDEPKRADIISEISRSFPNDTDKRLDGYIITKLGNFLQSLSIRMKLADATDVAEAKSEFSARKSRIGKKGGLEAIIAAGMMMKGMLFTLAMGALAALAGKALMTGLMALMLSTIVGLKSLTSGGHKSTTYEIVAKPVHQVSHSHSVSHEDFHGGHAAHSGHGYSGYGRSLNIVLPDHLKDPNIK